MSPFLRQKAKKRRRSHGPPVKRYAAFLFLLTATLVAAVAFTLDRNAQRSNWNQAETALAGGARVAAASLHTLRSNLRVSASQLATSLPLQRALVTRDRAALARIARARHAKLILHDRTVGALPRGPRITSTATIVVGDRVLARVVVGLSLGDRMLALMRQTTPLPRHAALLFVRDGVVVAGARRGLAARLADGRVHLAGTAFAAKSAPVGIAGVSIVAVEPAAAVDAASARYRRLVILAALVSIVLVGTLATRLARPLAQVMADVGRLTRQAQTDALTGLANRRTLDEVLDLELLRAAARGVSLSYVLLDVDNFKSVNDVHGHQVGDELLRAVAAAVRDCIREGDLAARYGGEELAVILPNSPLDGAKRSAERMRAALEQIRVETGDGEPLGVTASFGVAEFPTYPTAEALVGAADAALYQAKRSGKNRVATATVQGDGELAPAAPGVPVSG